MDKNTVLWLAKALRGALGSEGLIVQHFWSVLPHEVVRPVDQVEDEERPGEEAAAQTINGHGVIVVVLRFLGVCSNGLRVLQVIGELWGGVVARGSPYLAQGGS